MDSPPPSKRIKVRDEQSQEVDSRIEPNSSSSSVAEGTTLLDCKKKTGEFAASLKWEHLTSYHKPERVAISKPTEIACMTRNKDRVWLPNVREGLATYEAPRPGVNLNIGFESFMTRYQPEKPEPIRNILNCLQPLFSLSANGSGTCEKKPSFVCWRGTLTKFMCFPYSQRDEFQFGIWKHKDVIYIHSRETEKKQRQDAQLDARGARFMYYGYKFEECCTRSRSSMEFDRDVDTSVQFGSVFKVKVGEHRIIASAEVDCEDSDDAVKLPPGAPKNDRYRELKVTAVQKSSRATRSFERFKLLKWYCQSFIAGVPKLVAGFRDDNGFLCSTQTFIVPKIPQLISGRESDLWDSKMCISFLEKILAWMKVHVTEEDTMYELAYTGDKSPITLKYSAQAASEVIPAELYI